MMVLQIERGSAKTPTIYSGKPPYAFNTLRAPLTAGQRAQVLAYCKHFFAQSVGGSATDETALTQPTFSQFSNYSDQSVINTYDSIVGNTPTPPGADPGQAIAGVGPIKDFIPNPIKGVTDFLNRLWNTLTNGALWLRIGEGVLGIALILAGAVTVAGSKIQPLPVKV